MNILYYIAAVIIAVIFGIWLRQAAYDELKTGRKWIMILFVLSIIGIIIFFAFHEPIASLTCLAIAIISCISLNKRR